MHDKMFGQFALNEEYFINFTGSNTLVLPFTYASTAIWNEVMEGKRSIVKCNKVQIACLENVSIIIMFNLKIFLKAYFK